ncbi:5123_t:CDS:2 [Paraglomus brasilianum]|uniref:5123_t:CDS:1 n=1 Tax=Paraglomus brasilianum TaxID=144538 RepID=A0A9N9APK2_9GLOM|nr:5123_t:CDS:2 [Paraglomus brasilianum]
MEQASQTIRITSYYGSGTKSDALSKVLVYKKKLGEPKSRYKKNNIKLA